MEIQKSKVKIKKSSRQRLARDDFFKLPIII